MESIMLVGGIAVVLFAAMFYLAPIGRAGRALLVRKAEGNNQAMEIVERVLSKRYVSYWEFEQTSNVVQRVIQQSEDDATLSAIDARNAIKRASRRA